MLGIGALLIAGLLAGRLAGLGAGAQSVPPIHDIQTNWADPVELSAGLMAARGEGSNPVLYGDEARFPSEDREDNKRFFGRLISDIQEEAECETDGKDACEDGAPKPYGPIEPLLIDAPRADVFAAAERIAHARGWDIVTSDASAGILEATHTSPWWGFKDDVAIRIREACLLYTSPSPRDRG